MNRLPRHIAIGLLVGAFASCNPTSPSESLRQRLSESPLDGTAAPVVSDAGPHTFDMCDAEMSIEITAVVAEDARAANISVDELINMKKELDLVTVDVTPPFPEELWLTFLVETKRDLGQTAVALRADVYRDKAVVDAFGVAIGGQSETDRFEYRVNALEGLDPAAKRTVIYAQADIVLLPQDADVGALDINAAVAAAGDKGVVLSNPVCINFKDAEGTP